jgi:hypothetical protein
MHFTGFLWKKKSDGKVHVNSELLQKILWLMKTEEKKRGGGVATQH